MAIVRQDFQHGQTFAQTFFVGSGERAQFLHQPRHHGLRIVVAKIAQDSQYQGVGLVAGVQAAVVDSSHVDHVVAVAQLRAVQPGRHGQPLGADVDQALLDPVARMRQMDVGQVAQHPHRHLTVVGVLNFQVEDERVALGGRHFGDQIGAAVFDALLLAGEQFGVDQIQPEQIDRHV